jgi:hypothetical protein
MAVDAATTLRVIEAPMLDMKVLVILDSGPMSATSACGG